MMKRFFADWGGSLADGWRVLRALPWLIVAMIAIEMAQHVVEVSTGFLSADAAVRHAAGLHPLRMALGWPKMLATWALAAFAIRYLVLGDAAVALRVPARAWRRYAGVVLFQLIPFAVILYAEPIVAALGLTPVATWVLRIRLAFGLAQQLFEPLLLLWFVNAAIGTTGFGPIASARVTRWWYFWGLLLVFVTRLPFNLLHQVLNRWPVGHPAVVLWPLLAIDAMLVGVMVVTIAAAQVRAARLVVERRGIPLLAER